MADRMQAASVRLCSAMSAWETTAALNMGDCFAYACAKSHKAKLLYKGADFARTDLG